MELRDRAERWRRDLVENVLPFWLKHSIDHEHGGYFTTLGPDGELLSDVKYHWLQGREVWTFAKMHNSYLELEASAELREQWWAATVVGAPFLSRAKTGDNDSLLYFSTTREGHPLHLQRKPYTAVFYILACLEFAEGIKQREMQSLPTGGFKAGEWLDKALAMFAQFRQWIDDPTLCGRPAAPPGHRGSSNLGEVMCLAGLAEEVIAKLPDRRAEFMPDVEEAMRRARLHYDQERRIFMESADFEAGVTHSTMSGRLFVPGHSIEVSWFLLHLCRLRHDVEVEQMALDALDGALSHGWDAEKGGGLLYMMDILGKPMLDATVTANHKLWWPHCEALYACTLAYERTKDQKWAQWIGTVDEYCYSNFCDGPDSTRPGGDRGGEWFGYLERDGAVFNACKGGNYKGCFHVPRSLLYSFIAAKRIMPAAGAPTEPSS